MLGNVKLVMLHAEQYGKRHSYKLAILKPNSVLWANAVSKWALSLLFTRYIFRYQIKACS